MANHDSVLEVEVLEELKQIVRVGVHFVTLPRLARSAMAATIMGDATVASGREEEGLIFPVIGTQGPAMRQCDDGAGLGTPVFVVDLCAISGGEGGHDWNTNDEGEGVWGDGVNWLSKASRKRE